MQQVHRREVSLVLGGVGSGKSRFALELAVGYQRVVFIATAIPSDPEMELRIERHRQSRPKEWKTIEAPSFGLVERLHER